MQPKGILVHTETVYRTVIVSESNGADGASPLEKDGNPASLVEA
jgi:hypothetical protein